MAQKKICIHWTAGNDRANSIERDHYHYIVERLASNAIVEGLYDPEDNFRGLRGLRRGYAAHCGGGNSWTIGVALAGGTEQRPLMEAQCEKAWELIARLCLTHGIPVNSECVYTHYEFGLRNPKTSSRGKPDINRLWHVPKLHASEVGDYIRNKITWYYNRFLEGKRHKNEQLRFKRK